MVLNNYLVRAPMRLWIFFSNSANPFTRTMALSFTQILKEINIRKCFWGAERGRLVRLTNLPPSVSLFFKQCGVLSISQPYRPSRSIMEKE
jgi:hypothetical protein